MIPFVPVYQDATVPAMNDQLDTALLVVRLAFGFGLAAHGYNKVFGGGGLTGTAGWFESVGMKWPALQARLAAATEITTGLLFAAGLLTPFAAAGMIGLMTVAFWVVHRNNGFLITKGGWEYVAAIAVVAWAVATIGPGTLQPRRRLRHRMVRLVRGADCRPPRCRFGSGSAGALLSARACRGEGVKFWRV